MFAKSKMHLVAASLALPIAFLAGCGGGGNGIVNPTPTPVGSPTPIPTVNPANVPLATVIGLTNNNSLVRFNTRTPGTFTPLSLSGLPGGETLLGIDFRFAPSGTGQAQLYGLSRRSSGVFQLYIIGINSTNANFVPVGSGFSADNVSSVGFDFNPNVINPDGSRVDRIRVVSPTRANFRVNPDTGTFVDSDSVAAGQQGDGTLAFATGDANANIAPRLAGAAYTNNDSDPATGTVNYAIDGASGTLVTQGRPASGGNAAVSPNTGQLFTVGSLGFTLNNLDSVGFDIAPGNNTAFASFDTGFYIIDLGTGRASLVGNLGMTSGSSLVGLAIVP